MNLARACLERVQAFLRYAEVLKQKGNRRLQL